MESFARESFAEANLSDRIAAEFDRLEVRYRREKPDLFALPCSSSSGRLEVKLLVEPALARLVVPGLFHASTEEDYKTVGYLNYKVLPLGRLGVDVEDGEVRFEAEVVSPDESSVASAFVGAWRLSELAQAALGRVRFGGLTAHAAVEASLAEVARERAVDSIDDVAREAWDKAS